MNPMLSFPLGDLHINPPQDFLGWVGLIVWIVIIILFIIKTNKGKPVWKLNYSHIVLYSLAAVLTKVLISLKGFPLHLDWLIPPDGVNSGNVILLFSALPWILAGLESGLVLGSFVGCISGIATALLFTHNYYSIIEYTTFAMLFAYFVGSVAKSRQFQLLQHPIMAISLVALIALPIHQYTVFFEGDVSFAVRLDNALSRIWLSLAVTILELIIAGLIAEVAYWASTSQKNNYQDGASYLEEEPLKWFLLTTIPFILYSFIFILAIGWNIFRYQVREDLEREYITKAKLIGNSLVSIITNDQIILKDLASNELFEMSSNERNDIFNNYYYPIPYFDQFALFNKSGEYFGGYPITAEKELEFSADEIAEVQESIQSKVNGFTISNTATTEFILSLFQPIINSESKLGGILVGRTNLINNPTNMFFNSIAKAIVERGSFAKLVKSNGIVLSEIGVNEDIMNEEDSILIYYPLSLNGWGIQIFIPYEIFVTEVWSEVSPYIFVVVAFELATFAILWARSGKLSLELKKLSDQIKEISVTNNCKQINALVPIEMHCLIDNLEKMRKSFIKKSEHQDFLLNIWQALGDNMGLDEISRVILNVFLNEDVVSARLIVNNDSWTRYNTRKISFGIGSLEESFGYLDDRIIELLSNQKRLLIPNTRRIHYLEFQPEYPRPKAIAAFSIGNNLEHLACLWIAYKLPRDFSKEEIRELLLTVKQISSVISFYKLIDERKVEAAQIKNSLNYLTNPIFIFINNKLLIANESAEKFVNIDEDFTDRTMIEKRIKDNEILHIVDTNYNNYPAIIERTFSSGRIFKIVIHKKKAEPLGQITVLVFIDTSEQRRREKMLSDYLNIISHGLRSPLAIMRGYTTMLQMVGDLNDQQKDYVGKIVKGVDGATQMIGNLLDQERLDAGYGLFVEELNIVEIINEIVERVELIAKQKKIKIIKDYSASTVLEIYADQTLIKQAINNILYNAIKFSPVNSEVKIGLKEEDSQILIIISDSGIGIAQVDLPHIFEKYYCAQNMKKDRETMRSGMGLYLAKSIVDRHNGKIWVKSNLGRGSKFTIVLPKGENKE